MEQIEKIVKFAETMSDVLEDKKISWIEAMQLVSPSMGLFEAVKEYDSLREELDQLKNYSESQRISVLGIQSEKVSAVLNFAEGLLHIWDAFKS